MEDLKSGTVNSLPWAGHRKGMHLQSNGRGGKRSLVCSIKLLLSFNVHLVCYN